MEELVHKVMQPLLDALPSRAYTANEGAYHDVGQWAVLLPRVTIVCAHETIDVELVVA